MMKSFYEKIYSQLKKVPKGKVTTYNLYKYLNNPKMYKNI